MEYIKFSHENNIGYFLILCDEDTEEDEDLGDIDRPKAHPRN